MWDSSCRRSYSMRRLMGCLPKSIIWIFVVLILPVQARSFKALNSIGHGNADSVHIAEETTSQRISATRDLMAKMIMVACTRRNFLNDVSRLGKLGSLKHFLNQNPLAR